MSNEVAVTERGGRVCVFCGTSELVVTQPAAGYRIGGLPGSEAIPQDAKWANVCVAHVHQNNKALDRAYAKATGRRVRECLPPRRRD